MSSEHKLEAITASARPSWVHKQAEDLTRHDTVQQAVAEVISWECLNKVREDEHFKTFSMP